MALSAPKTAISPRLGRSPPANGLSPTPSASHSSMPACSAARSSVIEYFFLILPCASHIKKEPMSWLETLSTIEKCGTSITYPNASYDSPKLRVMFGKSSTENCLSDQPAHFCADGELKASSSAAETTPASPIRLRIVCAITGESFTCSSPKKMTGTLRYSELIVLYSFLVSGLTSSVSYGTLWKSSSALILLQKGQISYW
mmetsp:Transcript_23981/g.63291  ORF Transcript_23981/g.63291 Transcript_23981/m.63291 type:complete len:201 (-) Transcript_23981:149-751(-)